MSKIQNLENLDRPIKRPKILCPNPCIVRLRPTLPYFDKADFTSGQLSKGTGDFNATKKDRPFLHTVKWEPKERCCQVVKARVSVKLKSISGGQSLDSSDAGNDSIYLVKNGGISIVPGEKIYNNHPFAAGNIAIKKFTLVGSQLNWLNLHKRLSIYVQDDTAVVWIRVKLWVCCLNPPKDEKKKK